MPKSRMTYSQRELKGPPMAGQGHLPKSQSRPKATKGTMRTIDEYQTRQRSEEEKRNGVDEEATEPTNSLSTAVWPTNNRSKAFCILELLLHAQCLSTRSPNRTPWAWGNKQLTLKLGIQGTQGLQKTTVTSTKCEFMEATTHLHCFVTAINSHFHPRVTHLIADLERCRQQCQSPGQN